mgnify:CR=1 FL=1
MKFNISGIDVVIDQQDALMFVGVPLSIGANGYVRVSAKRPKNKGVSGFSGGRRVVQSNK